VEYETFVTVIEELPEGEEIELSIQDVETYEPIKVRAILSSSKDEIPDGEPLRVRFSRGVLHPVPWTIKILERLPMPFD